MTNYDKFIEVVLPKITYEMVAKQIKLYQDACDCCTHNNVFICKDCIVGIVEFLQKEYDGHFNAEDFISDFIRGLD